jgi:hypothetical protein
MAHFAELSQANIVLRVVVIDNNDVIANGGDQSETAAKVVEQIVPFSRWGVKWIQTSYNNNFRKQYAGIGCTFDSTKNKFILPQPFTSWSLDANDDWQAPVAYPTVITYGDNAGYFIYWDEAGQRWTGKDDQNNEFLWIPESLSWIATGN